MSHLKFLVLNADTPVSKEQEGCNIKYSSLSCWFAFSLMEEDAFELKRKIREVLDGK